MGGGPFQVIGQAPVSSNGAYSFSETPLVNTVYQARTTFGAVHASAPLWQGVRDQLSLTPRLDDGERRREGPRSRHGPAGKGGRAGLPPAPAAERRRQSVEAGFVDHNSSFQFAWRFGKPGTYQFRARIYSDGHNVGAASTPVTITVSGLAPVSSLPSGS